MKGEKTRMMALTFTVRTFWNVCQVGNYMWIKYSLQIPNCLLPEMWCYARSILLRKDPDTFVQPGTQASPQSVTPGAKESLHRSLLFVALQGHDTPFKHTFHFLIDGDAATVECKIIFMHLSKKQKSKIEAVKKLFCGKKEIGTRLVEMKDWWRGIQCL